MEKINLVIRARKRLKERRRYFRNMIEEESCEDEQKPV